MPFSFGKFRKFRLAWLAGCLIKERLNVKKTDEWLIKIFALKINFYLKYKKCYTKAEEKFEGEK